MITISLSISTILCAVALLKAPLIYADSLPIVKVLCAADIKEKTNFPLWPLDQPNDTACPASGGLSFRPASAPDQWDRLIDGPGDQWRGNFTVNIGPLGYRTCWVQRVNNYPSYPSTTTEFKFRAGERSYLWPCYKEGDLFWVVCGDEAKGLTPASCTPWA